MITVVVIHELFMLLVLVLHLRYSPDVGSEDLELLYQRHWWRVHLPVKKRQIIPKMTPLEPQKRRERSWSLVYRDAQCLPFTSSCSYILSCSHWAITVSIRVVLWCLGLCSDCWHQSQGNSEDGAQIQQVFGHSCPQNQLWNQVLWLQSQHSEGWGTRIMSSWWIWTAYHDPVSKRK